VLLRRSIRIIIKQMQAKKLNSILKLPYLYYKACQKYAALH
jgi:hypothetical protein